VCVCVRQVLGVQRAGIITGKLKHSPALERHSMCVFVVTVIGPLPLFCKLTHLSGPPRCVCVCVYQMMCTGPRVPVIS